MDLQFGLIFWLIIGVAMFERAVRVDRKFSIADRIQHFLRRSQQMGTLGPPRLERHQGRLYVVGFGQCQLVRSREQGERLIARMTNEADGVVSALNRDDATLKSRAAQSRFNSQTPTRRSTMKNSNPSNQTNHPYRNLASGQTPRSSQRLWRYGIRSNQPTGNPPA